MCIHKYMNILDTALNMHLLILKLFLKTLYFSKAPFPDKVLYTQY